MSSPQNLFRNQGKGSPWECGGVWHKAHLSLSLVFHVANICQVSTTPQAFHWTQSTYLQTNPQSPCSRELAVPARKSGKPSFRDGTVSRVCPLGTDKSKAFFEILSVSLSWLYSQATKCPALFTTSTVVWGSQCLSISFPESNYTKLSDRQGQRPHPPSFSTTP